MPIDPSISLQAGQGVTPLANPLDTYGKVATLANTLSQNRLIDASAQNAVDQNRNIRLQGDTSAQALGSSQQSAINNAALSLAKLPDDQIGHETYRTLDNLVQSNVITQQQAKSFGDVIAQTGNGSTDPAVGAAHLRAMLQGYAMRGLPQGAQYEQAYGVRGTMSDGQSLQPGVFAPPSSGGGFTPSGQATNVYPSRADLATRTQTGLNSDGSVKTGPLANVTPPNLAGPAARQPLGDGRFPSALRNPANATPAVPNDGNVTTSLGPASVAAKTATGAQSADAFQKISEEGDTARAQDAVLANMQNDAAQYESGPGQDKIKQFQAVVQRIAPGMSAAFGIKPEAIAANESFDKLVANLADAQGAKSDSRLSVTQAGIPSSSLTPEGRSMILNQLRGNTDYKRAIQKMAAAYPDKADREGFSANVANNLDPRAFQYARLTPVQRGNYLANIKDGSDMSAFQASYLWAEKNGLIGNANAGR